MDSTAHKKKDQIYSNVQNHSESEPTSARAAASVDDGSSAADLLDLEGGRAQSDTSNGICASERQCTPTNPRPTRKCRARIDATLFSANRTRSAPASASVNTDDVISYTASNAFRVIRASPLVECFASKALIIRRTGDRGKTFLVDRWYRLISRCATVPGRHRCGFRGATADPSSAAGAAGCFFLDFADGPAAACAARRF